MTDKYPSPPETVWAHLAHAHKLLSRMGGADAQEVRHTLGTVAETLRIWNQRIVDVGVLAMQAAAQAPAGLSDAKDAPQAAGSGISDEQIQDAVTNEVQLGRIIWSGYRGDSEGRYTIPALSPCHFQLVRLGLAMAPVTTQEVMIDFDQIGMAGPFPVVDGRVQLPAVTMRDLARMLKPTTDSLAAADVPAVEREPRRLRKFLQALQAGEMSVSRAVELLEMWLAGTYSDDQVPEPPEDSALIQDDKFPMELVRELRARLAAAPAEAGSGQGGDVDLIARGMRWEEAVALMKDACAQAGVEWGEEEKPQDIAINVMQRLANAAHKVGFTLGKERMRAALAAPASQAAVSQQAGEDAGLLEQLLDGLMDFRHTPEGMVRGGRYVNADDLRAAIRQASLDRAARQSTPQGGKQ